MLKNYERMINSNLERNKTKINIWFVIASLSYIAAIGFIIAYLSVDTFPISYSYDMGVYRRSGCDTWYHNKRKEE